MVSPGENKTNFRVGCSTCIWNYNGFDETIVLVIPRLITAE